MSQFWEPIECDQGDSLASLTAASREVVVLSTHFDPRDKFAPAAPSAYQLNSNSIRLLDECARILQFGGLLFVYGLPRDLALWGQRLSFMGDAKWKMVFKYWIALSIDDAPRHDFLKPAHQGLLMFLKSKTNSQSPFRLNTSTAKMPHMFCSACGENLKDWGGKKHLMNPKGTALSDIWRDLPEIRIKNSTAPACVLDRIHALTAREGSCGLHLIQKTESLEAGASPQHIHFSPSHTTEQARFTALKPDEVYLGDCISFLNWVGDLHPSGVFDLAFADPPYNLKKLYSNYDDTLAEQHYIEWCDRWLDGMVRTLKPGGSLFVLNLPKWALHHAAFLNQWLKFRHWIAWDALSDPRGKLMPAHYALLYYTKPGAKPVFNYSPLGARTRDGCVLPPDAPQYCLRASCVKERKRRGDDARVELSDVWFDVHRIKHKRDRDAHPCQLPEKLMERIILLTTRPGDLVFDPFCGAGTSAIAAMKLGRQFIVTDVDANYVRITKEKLAAMKASADLFGNFSVVRKSAVRPRAAGPKKAIETCLQDLARQLGRMPTEQDIEASHPSMLREIDSIYPCRSAALKRCKVVLAEAPANQQRKPVFRAKPPQRNRGHQQDPKRPIRA